MYMQLHVVLKPSKPDPLNTGIPMEPNVFVGPNFFPSIFNVIKHPKYRIISIQNTGEHFRPKSLDLMYSDLSIPDDLVELRCS